MRTLFVFFSSRRRHTRCGRDWSSDVCSSDLHQTELVTHADVMADEFITNAIRERFPDHRILSEETMPDLSQAESLNTPLWVIDPIDGTVNYAYGHPQVAVSIAYAERGQVQVGVVHAPFPGETFRATKG